MVVLDNLGMLLAGIIVPLQTGSFSKNIAGFKSTLGLLFTLGMWGTNPTFLFNNANTNQAQVGKGVTPVTRQDFVIGSAFSVGVEASPQNSQIFGYNSGLGKVTIATQIAPTGGSGSITEVIKINRLRATTGADRFYLLTRDVISPVAFIIGQTIDTEHIFLI